MLFCEKLKGAANFPSFIIAHLPVLRHIAPRYSMCCVQIVILLDIVT